MLNQIASEVLTTFTNKDALTTLIEHPQIHLSDALLEAQLMTHLEEIEQISDVAIYGYQNHLRIVMQVQVGSQSREAMVQVTPEHVIWGDQYQLVFRVELSELKSSESNSWLSLFKGILKDRLWDIIPLGSIISKLSDLIICKIYEHLGSIELQRSTGDFSWVKCEGNYVTIDLEQSPQLSFLWNRPKLDFPILDNKIPRMIDCFELTDLSADRTGLTLHIEASSFLNSLFK